MLLLVLVIVLFGAIFALVDMGRLYTCATVIGRNGKIYCTRIVHLHNSNAFLHTWLLLIIKPGYHLVSVSLAISGVIATVVITIIGTVKTIREGSQKKGFF